MFRLLLVVLMMLGDPTGVSKRYFLIFNIAQPKVVSVVDETLGRLKEQMTVVAGTSSEGADQVDFIPEDSTEEIVVESEPEEYVFNPYDYSSSVGDKGRLVIPDVGVNVGLYCGTEADGWVGDYAQSVTDAQDSAVVLLMPGHHVIGDHWNQGFDGIKSAVPGETLAYVVYGDASYETWRCVGLDLNGVNDGYTIWTSDGRNVYDSYLENMIMYTCNGNWQHIAITEWTRIG